MKSNNVYFLLCFILVTGEPAFSQKEMIKPVDHREMKAVADSIISLIRMNYLFSEKSDSIAISFMSWFSKQSWSDTIGPADFANALSQQLVRQSGDLHFFVQYAASKKSQGALQVFGWLGKDYNYGIAKTEWLPGQIGYIDYRFFNFTMMPEAKQAIDQVMQSFSAARAVIIDLRDNPGGDGEMGAYFFSYLIPEDSVVLLSNINRSAGISSTSQLYSYKYLPSPRINNMPVYVLTDGGTGSTSELFSILCRTNKAAHLVGEATAGGGHNMSVFPLGERFTIGIPTGRYYDPKTGKGIQESDGVHPDTECDQEDALAIAHQLALKEITAKTTDTTEKKKLDYLLKTTKALYPSGIYDDHMKDKAGIYGTVTISCSNGRLFYQRSGRKAKKLLIQTGPEEYGVNTGEGPLLRFEKDAQGNYDKIAVQYSGNSRIYPLTKKS